jgi:hypothetical protein
MKTLQAEASNQGRAGLGCERAKSGRKRVQGVSPHPVCPGACFGQDLQHGAGWQQLNGRAATLRVTDVWCHVVGQLQQQQDMVRGIMSALATPIHCLAALPCLASNSQPH